MTEIQLFYYWTRTQLAVLQNHHAAASGDPERGDGILAYVVFVSIVVAATLTIAGIIVAKALLTANNTQTQ